ncbi:MFS transporter [Acanthopleuribacter pedis]|uniref:MFS transporter n=1 Tax=Acanthopleuribacter pedis TaxID=442870 RepID=A0A8J7U2U0_9BACT|nr:MFS transporter [Acanthopleuribacter pedis]MBO1318089.1 MFS transporter [Acanthopleuribacter pedis]
MLTAPPPRSVQAGYGAAEIGITAGEFFIQVTLLKFYVDTVGLSPGLAGLALSLAVVWDAVSDPLMGYLSDRTRLAAGRRRPYLPLGAVGLALTFVLLFSPPDNLSQTAAFSWLLGSYVLLNTAMTVIAVPHLALAADMTPNPRDRTALFGWRFLFANIGLITAILVPGLVAAENAATGAATRTQVLVIAGLVVATALLSFRATRGYDHPAQATHPQNMRLAWQAASAPLRNRAFLLPAAAFVLGSIGRTLNSAIALFYYQVRLHLDEQTMFLKVLLPFTLVVAVSIIGWVAAAKRVGKKWPAVVGIGFLGVSTVIVYPLFPVGQALPPAIYGVVAGLLIGAVFLLDAMVSDAADLDHLRRGQTDQGIYFGYWRMAAKVARALGLALSGFLLEWIGFQQGAPTQSEATAQGLAILFGPVVGAFFIAAALLLPAWPLSVAKERQISRLVVQRLNRR